MSECDNLLLVFFVPDSLVHHVLRLERHRSGNGASFRHYKQLCMLTMISMIPKNHQWD